MNDYFEILSNQQQLDIMQLSLATLAYAFISIVAARDLSVVKQDAKKVIVKSKSDADTLWFILGINNGVPSFEIKGTDKDVEADARASVHLALDSISEEGAKTAMSLAGTQAYWSDIHVDTIGEDKNKLDRVIIHSNMIHTEKDISGNYFQVRVEALIEKDGKSFNIRPMIQNFPYNYAEGKGILSVSQLIGSTLQSNASMAQNKIAMSTGELVVIPESAFEDGNPTTVKQIKFCGKDTQGIQGCSVIRRTDVTFGALRPKNATFAEQLIFNQQSIKIPQEVRGETKDKVKGMTINGSTLTVPAIGLGLGGLIMAFLGLLA